MDERTDYVTFREHTASKEENARRMHAIELEQAAQRTAIANLPSEMQALRQTVMDAIRARPQTGTDMVLYSAADAAKSLQHYAPNTTNGPLWLLMGAMLAVIAFLGWQVVAK